MATHRTQGRGANGLTKIVGSNGVAMAGSGNPRTRTRRHIPTNVDSDPAAGIKAMSSYGRGAGLYAAAGPGGAFQVHARRQ